MAYPLVSYRPDPALVARVDAAAARDHRSRQGQLDHYIERGLLTGNGIGPAADAETVAAIYGLYEDDERLNPREAAAFRKTVAALSRIAGEDAAREA